MIWRLENDGIACTRYKVVNGEIECYQHKLKFNEGIVYCDKCELHCVLKTDEIEGDRSVVIGFYLTEKRGE